MTKRILCFVEFYNNYNSCNSDNISNSITFHNLSIIPIDSSVESNKFTYSVAIGHKDKRTMTIKTFYTKTINEIIYPNNKKYFVA